MKNIDPQPSHARAHPPETLEGWYALHQIFTVNRLNTQSQHEFRRSDATPSVDSAPQGVETKQQATASGWSAWVRLIGSKSDLMAMHFAPTLDAIGEAQNRSRDAANQGNLRLDYSFLSVTEAGLYHLTAELAREAVERGGQVGDEAYAAEVSRRAFAERDSAHVRRRLYPEIPPGMPYVSFYPMSKRRDPGQNWYTLSLDERSRLMQTHGKTGRRYAGRVVQIITGAIGFDAWEWGVTLFAADPLDFKKLVTDMRFDEVSANYADFGEFYVGKLIPEGELPAVVETM